MMNMKVYSLFFCLLIGLVGCEPHLYSASKQVSGYRYSLKEVESDGVNQYCFQIESNYGSILKGMSNNLNELKAYNLFFQTEGLSLFWLENEEEKIAPIFVSVEPRYELDQGLTINVGFEDKAEISKETKLVYSDELFQSGLIKFKLTQN